MARSAKAETIREEGVNVLLNQTLRGYGLVAQLGPNDMKMRVVLIG